MADFSFSFDSDNPFAEPEAPKKAPAATNDPAPTSASAPAAPEAQDDEFSLDSFDFAFDEGASVNDTLPTQTTPPEAAPRQLTPGEAAFAEFDFNAPASTEPEAPVAQSNDEASIEFELPDFDAPDETPARQAPIAEFDFNSPASTEPEAPVAEAPVAEAPVAEVDIAPTNETEDEAPVAEDAMVEFELPDLEAPATETPATEMPVAEFGNEVTSEFEMPDFEVSDETSGAQDALFVEETEIEDVAPVDRADKSAPTDLEEFNALALDLDVPDDDMFAPTTEVAPEIESAPVAETLQAEVASDEVASDEAFAEPMDEVAEVEVTAEAFAEPEGDVAELEVASDEAPAEPTGEVSEAEFTAEAPAEPVSEVSVADAVAAAGSLAVDEAEESEAEVRPRKPKVVPRVAILGASGIGKNHARWFHQNGCQVVGFLGSSADSTAQTEADLSAQFEFEGQPYTDLGELLSSEAPDIVCVATPPPLHFAHVLQCLEAGAHVLCEKPLVYAPTRKFRENRDGAKELVKVAAKKNLNLGTQLQYGAAVPILCKLAGLSPHDVGDFAMELETLNANSPRNPHELWIDLGPHPISVAQMLAGSQATLAEETIRFEPHEDDEKTEVLARFGINCSDGRLLMVRAVVRALRGETKRKPRRRFSFNGHAVTYAPLQTSKGGFQAQFVAPDGYASVYSDPVNYLIGDFVRSCVEGRAPLVTGDFGRENLEWMLKVGAPDEAR